MIAGVTVNKYSPEKVLPDYLFTSEKVLPQYLLPREKVLPLGKKCSLILKFWLHVSRNTLLGVFFFPGKIYSLRNRSIAHWTFECFDDTIHCL